MGSGRVRQGTARQRALGGGRGVCGARGVPAAACSVARCAPVVALIESGGRRCRPRVVDHQHEAGLSLRTLFFLLRTAPRNTKPPTANANRQPPPTAANRQPLFKNASVVLSLVHVLTMRQSVPMKVRFCWRYEPPFPPLRPTLVRRCRRRSGLRRERDTCDGQRLHSRDGAVTRVPC